MKDFHRSNLTDQCTEIGQRLVIGKLPDIEFQCRNIEESDSEILTMALNCKNKLRLIAL